MTAFIASNPSGLLGFVFWFLNQTGVVLASGFFAALLLSDFGKFRDAARSGWAILLSAILVFIGLGRPVFSDGPRAAELPWAVAAAFGLAFAISRLRECRGRTPLGWLCGGFHVFFLATALQTLPHG